jgi:hypothetical protein
MAADVALITMPFFVTSRPSLATGLLKAELASRHVSCECLYFNIEYCEMVGKNPYHFVNSGNTTLLLGEWLFSHALWGPDPTRDASYLNLLFTMLQDNNHSLLGSLSRSQAEALIQRCRDAIDPCLDRCTEIVLRNGYRVIGFSSTFQQNIASLALAKRIKQSHPELTIVFGSSGRVLLYNIRKSASITTSATYGTSA